MLFAGTLVNRVGGFVLVFLAIYLTDVRGLSAAQAGTVMAAYGLGAIAGGPLGGALSDRIGRKPTLTASLFGGGASMLLLGFVTSTPGIVAAAIVTGLLYEMYRPVVAATVADVVSGDDRPRAYALIYWAVNIGASIAPIVGGMIAARSYRLLFAGDAVTTALYGFIVWAALPETRPSQARNRAERPSMLRTIGGDPIFVAICVLNFAFSIVFFQSFVALPIDVRAHGLSATAFGGLITINGILIVLLQPLAGETIRGRSQPLVLACASLLLGIGFGLNAWAGSLAAYAATVAIWTLGEILYAPASTALVAALAPPELRGAYQGAFALAFTAAFAAAPAAGGYVIAHAGGRTLWLGCLVIGVIVSAGFMALNRQKMFEA